MDIGIQIENERICMLMYADDFLLAENADDLQLLLICLNDWCRLNNVNGNKSNIVHFHTNSQTNTSHVFKCGDTVIDIVDRYKYLGVILHANLDLNVQLRQSPKVLAMR